MHNIGGHHNHHSHHNHHNTHMNHHNTHMNHHFNHMNTHFNHHNGINNIHHNHLFHNHLFNNFHYSGFNNIRRRRYGTNYRSPNIAPLIFFIPVFIILGLASPFFFIFIFIFFIFFIVSNLTKSKYMVNEPYYQFERLVHSTIKDKFPNDKILINLFLQPSNSENKHLSIDLMLFSKKGIFVIELRDYVGSIEENTEEKWSLTNLNNIKIEVNNPLTECNQHISNLSNYYFYDYQGYVIVSNFTKNNINNSKVLNLDQFIEMYSKLEENNLEFEKCYQVILEKMKNSN